MVQMTEDIRKSFRAVWTGEQTGLLMAAESFPSHCEAAEKRRDLKKFPQRRLEPQIHKLLV